MTPTLLRTAGEALYGSLWQSEMARALGVADRTVRRWAAGQFQIPAGVWPQVRELLAERGAVLARIRRQLPK
jgi:DNA-binding transcriptional regulator YdaS (Cro superfamily)